jgi:MFS family permease
VLSTALGVPITEQGAMVGRLNVYTEVVLMLIFTPLGVLSDRIGRRAVYAFGFSCLALSYALFPYATSETELALIRVIYSVGLGQGGCSQQWHGHRCSAGSGPDTLHHPQSAGLGFAIIAIFLLDRFHRVTGLAICMGLAASGYLLLGVGQISALLGSTQLIGKEAPAAQRGSVIGAFSVAGALGILITSGIGGSIFDSIDPRAPFVLLGLMNLVVLVAAVLVRIYAPGPAMAREFQRSRATVAAT